MLINTYANLSAPSVQSIIPSSEWLYKIKSEEYSEKINELRAFAKGGEQYNKIKKEELPCCTYNFLFNEYKQNSNIVSPTGLIYFDVDKPSFDISSLNLDKIYSYYKSVGGKGYSILAKVDGLTLGNFKTTYESIIHDLELTDFSDTGAIKASQSSVISADSEIFINDSSFVYQSSYTTGDRYTTTHKEPIIDGLEYDLNSIRYSNLSNLKYDSTYIVDWNNLKEIKCEIPMRKLFDRRKRTMIAYCCNYVFLNQWLPFKKVLCTMLNVNCLMCAIPLEDNIVMGIVKSIFQQKEEKRLQPIFNDRSINFSADCGFNKEEKLEICRELISKKRVADSKNKIQGFIKEWDHQLYGNITVRKLAKVSGMNVKTIAKYYSTFNDEIKKCNFDSNYNIKMSD